MIKNLLLLSFWYGANEYEVLDKLAIEAGTDKASSAHNYTEVYAQYFAPLRDQPIRFLEIGILYGASVKLWSQYFPNAELHFIDSNPGVVGHNNRVGVYYHILDQADKERLESMASSLSGKFDIIIDDGGHLMRQQMISFETLFPYLNSGGLYIIEDLHTSYWKNYGGNGNEASPKAGPGTTVEFLKNLVEDLNYTSGRTGYADWGPHLKEVPETLNEYQKNILFIHFYKSLCIIKKR